MIRPASSRRHREASLRLWWARGQKHGSFFPVVDHAGGTDYTVSVWTGGEIEVQFQQLAAEQDAEAHPFAPEAKRRELLARLNTVPGVGIPEDAIERRPSIRLAALAKPADRRRFLDALDWLAGELRAVPYPS